jgi:hypothetical protein
MEFAMSSGQPATGGNVVGDPFGAIMGLLLEKTYAIAGKMKEALPGRLVSRVEGSRGRRVFVLGGEGGDYQAAHDFLLSGRPPDNWIEFGDFIEQGREMAAAANIPFEQSDPVFNEAERLRRRIDGFRILKPADAAKEWELSEPELLDDVAKEDLHDVASLGKRLLTFTAHARGAGLIGSSPKCSRRRPGNEMKSTASPTMRSKRSTKKGDAREKIIAALTKHHQYADGSCLIPEPIGNNELARLAGVSQSTAKSFFDDKFQGLDKYKVICRDAARLSFSLKLLNNEVAPHLVLGDADREVATKPESDN